VGTQSEYSSSAAEREQRPLGESPCTAAAISDIDLSNQMEVRLAIDSGGSRAVDWRKPLVSDEALLLAKPNR